MFLIVETVVFLGRRTSQTSGDSEGCWCARLSEQLRLAPVVLSKLVMKPTFIEINTCELVNIQGGDGFSNGYAAGKFVTKGLIGSMPDTACTQVGGPLLRSLGFPNAANGAEAAVRDVCAQAGHPVQESK